MFGRAGPPAIAMQGTAIYNIQGGEVEGMATWDINADRNTAAFAAADAKT